MKKLVFILLAVCLLSLFIKAQTPAVRLEGQVVCCEDCWAEKDRTRIEYGNAEDLLKAKSCVEGGDPTLLAVRVGGEFKLYQLEQGKFRLAEKNWLAYVGKKVAVTGAVRQNKKQSVFRVDALEVLEKSLAEREAAAAVGTEIELRLKDLFGAEQNLAQYKGRIVILNFWATYCVPCRQEMPDLSAIQNEYAALGVQVIGASTDEARDRDKVLQFIKELKINFPIWTGATGQDMLRFGIGTALPASVVIGRDGKVVETISGIINPQELRQTIEKLLQNAEKQAKSETREKAKVSDAAASSVPS